MMHNLCAEEHVGTLTQTESRVSQSVAASTRLMSLDVFRGMTIAGMILVNNPGTWSNVYWPLEHAQWDGWTPTDLIFPFFLFIVGVSIVLSFDARLARGTSRKELLLHSLRRSAIIFGLGLLLSGFPHYALQTLRIPGVLQRIAVVYLIASVIVLFAGRVARWVIAISLLVGYFLLMRFVPVPGFGAGVLTPDGNLAAFIDRAVMYNHLYVAHRYDPEGILSTLPAIVTCLLGVFVGEWIKGKQPREIVRGLLVGAVVGLALGKLWGIWFPINKNLWSSSYVLFTAGFAMAVVAACAWLIDVRGWKRWARPFVWFGVNPLAIYFLASLLARASVSFTWDGVRWKALIYDKIFAQIFGSPYLNSLCFAITYVLLFWLIAWLLYRRKIFIKV
jgi:predicted acyltransferase